MSFLSEILAHKRAEVAAAKARVPEAALRERVEEMLGEPAASLRQSLEMGEGVRVIAEFKRRSPSKGWISEGARVEEVALGYERAGAAAVSILTDERFFGGSDDFVSRARRSGLRLPVLYKNFVVDPYQLLQARASGASAVLLIAACLSPEVLERLNVEAHALGLETLLELHSADEAPLAGVGADVVGVNNRDLRTFQTSIENSLRIRPLLPDGLTLVSESAIGCADDIRRLRGAGFRGFLVGEALMRESDPAAALERLLLLFNQ